MGQLCLAIFTIFNHWNINPGHNWAMPAKLTTVSNSVFPRSCREFWVEEFGCVDTVELVLLPSTLLALRRAICSQFVHRPTSWTWILWWRRINHKIIRDWMCVHSRWNQNKHWLTADSRWEWLIFRQRRCSQNSNYQSCSDGYFGASVTNSRSDATTLVELCLSPLTDRQSAVHCLQRPHPSSSSSSPYVNLQGMECVCWFC